MPEAPDLQSVASLHKYYHCSVEMKYQFAEVWGGPLPTDGREFDKKQTMQQVYGYMYITLWLGFLNCVCEGWEHLKSIEDYEIDVLVSSPYRNELKRCRNAVFHYQKDLFDGRIMLFFNDTEAILWAKALDSAFERWFDGPGGAYIRKTTN